MGLTTPKARILIIDDSRVARRMLVGQFKELGYQSIVEAESAEQGLERLFESRQGEPFSLIVTDLRMPGMSGDEFIRKIHQEPDFKKIPKLILTVETERGVVLNSLLTGADGFILKPITVAVLKDKIAKLIDKERKP